MFSPDSFDVGSFSIRSWAIPVQGAGGFRRPKRSDPRDEAHMIRLRAEDDEFLHVLAALAAIGVLA